MYDWDKTKRAGNLAKHGVDFPLIESFEWETSLTDQDKRHTYAEPRFVSIGFIGERLHVAVWTRRGERMRLISLRKANAREIKRYAENI